MAFADQAAIAGERTRLLRESENRRAQLEAMAQPPLVDGEQLASFVAEALGVPRHDVTVAATAPSAVKLDFSVPAALLGSLKAGLELRARTAAYDRDFNGKVTVVDSRVNTVDRSIRARAEFDNSEGLLKPGMLMTIELLRNPRTTLLVPEAALLTRDQQHSVWVIGEDQKLERRIIQIGSRQPGWVEVLDGLKEGETLVRANFPRLREGISVDASLPDTGAN